MDSKRSERSNWRERSDEKHVTVPAASPSLPSLPSPPFPLSRFELLRELRASDVLPQGRERCHYCLWMAPPFLSSLHCRCEGGRTTALRLLQLLMNPIRGKGTAMQTKMLQQLEKLWERVRDDEAMYTQLRFLFRPFISSAFNHTQQKKDGRADSRVDDMTQILKLAKAGSPALSWPCFSPNLAVDALLPIRRTLDVGCGDGSITAALACRLEIPAVNAHGCDIHANNNAKNFTYAQVGEDGKLPYVSASFDLVTVLMALHHFRDLPAMLSEIRRVLAPGGSLLIREHDCDTPALALVIDVQHGLHARVWHEKEETPSFANAHFARYRSVFEWTALLTKHGFQQHALSPDLPGVHQTPPTPYYRPDRVTLYFSNIDRHYYGLYVNPA